MNRLSLFDKLLVYALVFAMAAAGLFPILRPVFREWRRRMCASRLRAACSAVLLLALVYAGGSLDKRQNGPPLQEDISGGMVQQHTPPSCSGTHPAWYVARGYPQTDSDGDGIPDAWERWTRTNPNAEDALLDPDNDGVSNFEEYLYQCDPVRADTDGDGLDDRMEIDGLAAEVADMDPLVQATYAVTEPDTNGDGIPDLWGDPMDYVIYTDWNGNGYCDDLEYDFESITNGVDVLVTVSSSRSCVLEIGGENTIFIPPCTNHTIRVRVSANGDTHLRLLGAPDNTEITSTWKARLQVAWATDQEGCDIENDRIRTSDGTILDISSTQTDFAGPLIGTAPVTRLLLGAPPAPKSDSTSLSLRIEEKSLAMIQMTGIPYCSIHGPALTVFAEGFNVSPPYVWSVPELDFSVESGDTFSPADYALNTETIHIVCEKKDSHDILPLRVEEFYHAITCHPGQTNIVGAAWGSSHNPEDASDHAPGIHEEIEVFAENCPLHEATNTVVTIGVVHDVQIAHIRNLVQLVTGNTLYDMADHCIGIQWVRNGTINLSQFVSDAPHGIKEGVYYKVNGSTVSSPLSMGDEPSLLYPNLFLVEIWHQSVNRPLDVLVITLFNEGESTAFTSWSSTESASLSWTSLLPQPPRYLSSYTDLSNVIHTNPATPPNSLYWENPKAVESSSYMHHNACYEMRSKPVLGGHGHQATYDKNGELITQTIAAGTADSVCPDTLVHKISHRKHDVYQFFWALHLDGNPGRPDNLSGVGTYRVPTRLTYPCIYEGDYLRQYITCRPTTPTGIEENGL